jgi:hypothetical protein
VRVCFLIALLVVFCEYSCNAQFASPEQAILKNIKKKKWGKAEQQLQKSLSKDSSNAAGKYLYAVLYFSVGNPSFNIDSAYHYVNEALEDFHDTSAKERARLSKIPVDSLDLVKLRANVESAAFDRAKTIDTEGAYLTFLAVFKTARQHDDAIILRDEAAYREALTTNTYESFLKFLQKYPQAVRAGEARARYDRLLYESKTQDRTLRSYELFLMEFPATPYRREVEKHILQIMTASGEPETFHAFIERYARSSYRKIAENILYHLVIDSEHSQATNFEWSDSLKRVRDLDHDFLIPVLKNSRFGFMNGRGQTVIPFRSETLLDDYKCGNISEDVLIINGKLTGRSGHIVVADSVMEVEDLGIGFLKVTTLSQTSVYHKSGMHVVENIEDARVIADRFLAFRRQGKWNLSTLTGLTLTTGDYDDISAVNSVVIFTKDNKLRLSTPVLIGDVANNYPLKLTDSYDHVKALSKDLLVVKNGALQTLLDRNLGNLFPMAAHEFEKTFFGLTAKEKDRVTLYDNDIRSLGTYTKYVSSGSAIAVRRDSTMSFLNLSTRQLEPIVYDSIGFVGPFPVTFKSDSVTVHFNGLKRSYRAGITISHLPKKDSTGFVIVRDNGRRALLDGNGRMLFSGDYDGIEFAGENYFIIHRKEKKGLLSKHGKIVLPAEYDAIGNMSSGIVTLLKSMKFGVYNVRIKKLIKPQYDKNILVYNAGILATWQKGQYVFVDWNNKPIFRNMYDEVRSWSDTVALVRSGFNWTLLNLYDNKPLLQSVKNFSFIIDSSLEKLAIIKTEHNYGVISNKRGVVIPPTFSYIVNVGSSDHPVYFTEKHVEEASIFVVIYYDQWGKMLRREVYEEDDYEKIYCSRR